jgi:sugar/nucleoside kinase (ribokinase family)
MRHTQASGHNFDVVVIGNAGLDTNIYFQEQEINFDVEANFTENLDAIGQAGGYTARGFARLEYRTAFLGYLGDDFTGRHIRDTFQAEGINTEGIFIDPAGTGRSVNFMYPDGRRKNFYDGKSHMNLKPDLEQCRGILRRAKFALFSIPNWARYLLPLAKDLALPIACDIQDIVDPHDPYRQDFIAQADILFFSAVNHPDPGPLMKEILNKDPAKILISGMGSQGCALGTEEGLRYFPPVDLPSPVIDTNGAGDSLAVGFLSSYLLENRSLKESVHRGQIAARYTCSQKGTSDHLIPKEKLETLAQTISAPSD